MTTPHATEICSLHFSSLCSNRRTPFEKLLIKIICNNQYQIWQSVWKIERKTHTKSCIRTLCFNLTLFIVRVHNTFGENENFPKKNGNYSALYSFLLFWKIFACINWNDKQSYNKFCWEIAIVSDKSGE